MTQFRQKIASAQPKDSLALVSSAVTIINNKQFEEVRAR